MSPLKALFAVCALLPTMGLAQCPTKADLEIGIRFTLDTGATESFRILPSGVTEAVFHKKGEFTNRVYLAQGVYLLELIDLENGAPVPDTRVAYSYAITPKDMPIPQPNGSYAITATVLDGGEVRKEVQDHKFGPPSTITFGNCQYDMFKIAITYPGDTANNKDILNYMPALGISYLAQSTYDGGTDIYNYNTIEIVK